MEIKKTGKGFLPFFYVFSFLFFYHQIVYSQGIRLEISKIPTESSFRALSVVDDSVAWLAGTKGTIVGTTNRGKSWTVKTIAGFSTFDFRSLYAFDANHLVVANAGSPACILRSTDAGHSWTKVYENQDSAAFFDGIDFWNEKEGVIYGDPINGKILILKTSDSGQTWSPIHAAPEVEKGEASFAASGTGISCFNKSEIWLATGGLRSRLWKSVNRGWTWRSLEVPVIQEKNSTGIFSFAIHPSGKLAVVGGDYLNDSLRSKVSFFSSDNGNFWQEASPSTGGYRECVRFFSNGMAIAIGPGGIDLSHNFGKSWQPFSSEKGFHTLAHAKKGNWIVLAGSKGKVGFLIPQ